jgi:hypothetical protein
MPSRASSNDASPLHPAGVFGPRSVLWRLLLWLLREIGGEIVDARPIRVYYTFGVGGWRSRRTTQLHKVYRCR